MSVCKRTLYSVWRDEKELPKKFSAIEAFVFSNVIDKNKYTDEECNAIENKLRRFCSKLSFKWKRCHRSWKHLEQKNKAWLDGDLHLFEANIPTVAAGRPILDTNKMIRTVETDLQLPIKYTPEEALALYIDGNFTKSSYKLMQTEAKMRKANIYPTYDTLKFAKRRCYPGEVKVTEHSSEVPLQKLLDHTIARIVEGNLVTFSDIRFNGHKYETLTAVYKWGCDVSSGLPIYGQSSSNSEHNMIDEHLFAVYIVPLKIQLGSSILWNNPRPSSTRYCRPLKIIFETADLVCAEIEKVKAQIMKIEPTKLGTFHVQHHLQMATIDDKVLSIIDESSSQTCGICKASPKIMNDLDFIRSFPTNENLYEFGLSSSHAWIQCFECILQISYRLPIKKWQIRDHDKIIVDRRKAYIENKLRTDMALLVDIPMQGSGNTNRDKTARRFFAKPQLSSQITGVSVNLIRRFGVILHSMGSGFPVNSDAFRLYALRTAKIFVEEYPWFYMPCSVHKILIHGADIINTVPLPIGMMLQEALEATNFRPNHTRKTSRVLIMADLIYSLLSSSDPLISTLSKNLSRFSNKNIILDTEVKSLLLHVIEEAEMSESDWSADSE